MLNIENKKCDTRYDLPPRWQSIAHAFVEQVRSRPAQIAIIDSLGTSLTYIQLLQAAMAAALHLKEELKSSCCVGIILPPSSAAAIINVALILLGKIPVNLNYTAGQRCLDAMLESAKITTIVSSEKMLSRIGLEVKQKLIFVEELKKRVGPLARLESWFLSHLLPLEELEQCFVGMAKKPSEEARQLASSLSTFPPAALKRPQIPATVIFTAGSTGDPKGVVLSHANILSNVHAIAQVGQVKPGELILGVIPFFHSFGLTVTLWAPLCLGCTVVYHYDPRDALRIADLCQAYKASTLICAPTMLAMYLRRCAAEKFATLKNCIVGGEKLKEQQCKEVKEKLHLTPLEGYGLAETGPVLCCNVGNSIILPDGRSVPGNKPGTVGRPLPGTAIRILDPDSRLELPAGKEGLIEVRGPQVMMGYMNRPDETQSVFNEGWFRTGDLGYLDEEGFLTVSGRLSQFSKIAGEMVPHLAVENEIMRLSGATANEVRVTSVPDRNRGERLVVLYSSIGCTPAHLVQELRQAGLPNLWIPESHDFICVDELPIFMNGKVDLRALKEIAAKHYPAS